MPCHRQEQMDNTKANCLWAMCSAKAFQQEMKLQSEIFVGFLRAVKSEGMEGQSSSEVQKIKWEDFANCIWQACAEFVAIFPKNLLKGVPPKRMGYEFKIDLKPDTAPIHKPIYKLSPLELQKAKT